jgi:hypothetical protein
MNAYEQQAYELGQEHARNAASWIIDGNADQEHYLRVLALMESGDADDYLPREPNLSGEYADDLTPLALYDEIMGAPVGEDSLSFETDYGSMIDRLYNAYEAGVSDTFHAECERLLLAATA